MDMQDDLANEPLPADFEKDAKQRYEALDTRELSFEAFLEHEKNEFQRQRRLDQNKTLVYKPAIGTITPCGNGSLDRQLDPAEWQGAYGARPIIGMFCNPVNFAT